MFLPLPGGGAGVRGNRPFKVSGVRSGVWALGLVALFGTGCQTASYYMQAIQGQCDIVSRREPMAKLLADPNTPEPLKEKFRLV